MRAGRAIALLGICCIASGGCAATGSGPRAATAGSEVTGRGAPARPPTQSATTRAAASSAPRAAASAAAYRVRPKDTLYSIAFRHHLDYRDLARWNRLGSDYAIAVGQVLLLHEPSGNAPSVPGANAGGSAKLLPPGLVWSWPARVDAAPRAVPGGGILLLGSIGQDVRAAGSGRVVYAGSGIRGYGNLVILKHGDTVLSAYAHNQRLLVREGEEVRAGQLIGRMGTGAHQIAALYFEIRLNGKPVDPLLYLPKKQ